MAANSALHYVAGISEPVSQLHRKLVKTPKTTIMASNPAIPSETSGLVSMPPLLQPNLVCTRGNKTIVAAFPDLKIEVQTIIVVPGLPEYTEVELQTFSSETLKLDDKKFWGGSQFAVPPQEIKGRQIGRFEHRAGSNGSIGALEYVFPGDGYKLIVAWSNAKDDLNKVYTVILRDKAKWTQIKESLDISGHISIFNGHEHGIPYSSWIEIEETSPTPTMRATVANSIPIAPIITPAGEITASPTPPAAKANRTQLGVNQTVGGLTPDVESQRIQKKVTNSEQVNQTMSELALENESQSIQQAKNTQQGANQMGVPTLGNRTHPIQQQATNTQQGVTQTVGEPAQATESQPIQQQGENRTMCGITLANETQPTQEQVTNMQQGMTQTVGQPGQTNESQPIQQQVANTQQEVNQTMVEPTLANEIQPIQQQVTNTQQGVTQTVAELAQVIESQPIRQQVTNTQGMNQTMGGPTRANESHMWMPNFFKVIVTKIRDYAVGFFHKI